MIYHTTYLEGTPFGDIHGCFAEAFGDYAVQAAMMDEHALRRRARKNNWSPELSAGVWAGDELVAISLTGIDTVDGEMRGYDICTGVIPGHRGRGVAGLLIENIESGLKRAGCAAFQLEVLQANAAGVRAYEKAGFLKARGLVSYAAVGERVNPRAGPFKIQRVDLDCLLGLSAQLEFEPSFEQRDSALAYLEDEMVLLGAYAERQVVAAIAYDPDTAWIMRLVTNRDFRRRGIASALLSELARQLPSGAELKAVNIDARDEATLNLMQRAKLDESIRQWEMRLDLRGQR